MKTFKTIHQIFLKKNISSSLKKLFFLNRGFSIVGVMVASAIGLIVVSAISQLFVNMSSQINNLGKRSARVFFNNQIGEDFKKNCTETLSHVKLRSDNSVSVISKLLEGEEVKFTKILRDDGEDTESTDVIIDLGESSEQEKLSAQYGMAGDIHFLLRCTDNSGSCDCNPDPPPDPFEECEKRWALTFISQSRERSFLKYEKNLAFRLNIKFTEGGTDPNLECDIEGFDTASSIDCVKIGEGEPTLVGCGSTQEIFVSHCLFPVGDSFWSLECTYDAIHNDCVLSGYNIRVPCEIDASHTAFGYNIKTDERAKHNVFIGYQVGRYDAVRHYNNVFLGYQAGDKNYGSGNVFQGHEAGYSNTTGANNVFQGHEAGYSNTTGANNVFQGYQVGYSNTTGANNVFQGYQVGYSNTTGANNVFQGYQVGYNNEADYNVFLGYQAGYGGSKDSDDKLIPLSGANNVFLGRSAGYSNTKGHRNIFIGDKAGYSNMGYGYGKNDFLHTYLASENVFIGSSAGYSNTTGRRNIFIGDKVGYGVTTGSNNVFIGHKVSLTRGSFYNIFLGNQAGYNNSGYFNVFLGRSAGYGGSKDSDDKLIPLSGANNVFLGRSAGYSNTKGHGNIFIGDKAGYSNMGYGYGENDFFHTYLASENVFLGSSAGYSNTTGYRNIFIGDKAGYSNTGVTGLSGDEVKFGSNNIFIGPLAGRENTSGAGNIFIGDNAGNTTVYQTESDRFIIGNNKNTASRTWIVGEIGTETLTVAGKQVCLQDGSGTGTVNCRPGSSRTLKKNIRPFKNFEKALEDILKTPLFTFEYKKDNPEKSRMGVISEELPKHLQLFNSKNVSYPDMPSIYGTFWASLKALYFKIQDLKQLVDEFKKSFSDFKEQSNNFVINLDKENTAVRKELFEVKAWFQEELSDIQKEISQIKQTSQPIEKRSSGLTTKWDTVSP